MIKLGLNAKQQFLILAIMITLAGCAQQSILTENEIPTNSIKVITNLIGMKFVQIPAGEFVMGSLDSEFKQKNDYRLPHKVKITKTFYMQTTEVTQKQWIAIMGSNPSYHKGDDLPVEMISWEGAQKFINKLNTIEGTNVYRLPTEAEWEYSCRAGSTTEYCFGNNKDELEEYAWTIVNSEGITHPVGQKKPNNWGLYDMHGNVEEWCSDWCGANYYSISPTDDPQGPSTGNVCITRGGGCFYLTLAHYRSGDRYIEYPGTGSSLIGFRVCRSVGK